jgi:nicotinamide phosphoribosyltransferase
MRHNLILDVDSYKLSHFNQYPPEASGLFSYIEARAERGETVFFGLQYYLKEYLSKPITREDIEEAAAFAQAHGEPFNREGWEYILTAYYGYIPVTIRAVPEGTVVPNQNVLVTVECTDEKVLWLATYLETAIQRVVWYGTTVATNSRKQKQIIARYLEDTADSMEGLPFKLHDFGGRGVSSEESARVAGAAHLVNFMGSDTISGIRMANHYYDCPMAAFSVPAAEHSTMTAWGKDREKEAFENILNKYGKPGAIVSVVSDAYDIFNAIRIWGVDLKQKVIDSGALLVIRPDSGEPVDMVLRVVREIEKYFGSTTNTKGYKVLNNVRVLQGDGIDTEMIERILFNLKVHGYSADNMVFGSGGALLQKVNRDTYKFAMKASAIQCIGKKHGNKYWKDVYKDPVTDPGKKSKKGRLTLLRSNMTGEYMTCPVLDKYDESFTEVLQVVYKNGTLYNETTFKEVRERAKI